MRPAKESFLFRSDSPVKRRLCDHPDCGQAGDYRAPKSRDRLQDYYFFCLNHVRAYNQTWNYFAGLSPEEVESYTRDATVWERPSWPLGRWGLKAGGAGGEENKLRAKAMRDIFGESETQEDAPSPVPPLPQAEREALVTLDLEPPIDFPAIKKQYRILVKKYHPDLHGGDPLVEEKFKSINHAFSTLRRLYGDKISS